MRTLVPSVPSPGAARPGCTGNFSVQALRLRSRRPGHPHDCAGCARLVPSLCRSPRLCSNSMRLQMQLATADNRDCTGVAAQQKPPVDIAQPAEGPLWVGEFGDSCMCMRLRQRQNRRPSGTPHPRHTSAATAGPCRLWPAVAQGRAGCDDFVGNSWALSVSSALCFHFHGCCRMYLYYEVLLCTSHKYHTPFIMFPFVSVVLHQSHSLPFLHRVQFGCCDCLLCGMWFSVVPSRSWVALLGAEFLWVAGALASHSIVFAAHFSAQALVVSGVACPPLPDCACSPPNCLHSILIVAMSSVPSSILWFKLCHLP